jgi:CheY-like chemotaxis protein
VSAENRAIHDGNKVGLPAGDYLVIAVEDNGSGIAPALLEQVLEPFFTTKEVGKGTGLGLSMVYGFAKQSGGGISIQSRVGEGTRVEIWLPRAPDADCSIDAEAAPRVGTLAAQGQRALTILLADDHASVRTTTAALLADLGHRVVEAGGAHEAIELLGADKGRFDLLVTDYAMPLMSGTELIEKAREMRPGLPALLITGYADAQSISRRPEDVAVVAKPFTTEQFSTAIIAAARSSIEPETTRPPLRAAS